MNSPPTPPYCGSVAAALHLMNSQIRCGSCREKVYGVFYKLRDKERSKESAYVLVAFRFLARPFVSFVCRIARYAPSSTDKSSSLRNPLNLIFRTPLKTKFRPGSLFKWEAWRNLLLQNYFIFFHCTSFAYTFS